MDGREISATPMRCRSRRPSRRARIQSACLEGKVPSLLILDDSHGQPRGGGRVAAAAAEEEEGVSVTVLSRLALGRVLRTGMSMGMSYEVSRVCVCLTTEL